MLKIENLKKDYDKFHLDCSLQVMPGCVTGLIGLNGAGKSTTFKAALGLIFTDGGTIQVLGKDMKDFTPKDKQKLGVVLSDSGFSGLEFGTVDFYLWVCTDSKRNRSSIYGQYLDDCMVVCCKW